MSKEIIVADKGFPPGRIREELKERPDLHFLTPIKRNDVRIAGNDILSFKGVLTGIEAHVVYKKKRSRVAGTCMHSRMRKKPPLKRDHTLPMHRRRRSSA